MAAVPDPRQGVFETLLVVDGRPVELEAHLARLEASLDELFPDRETPDLTQPIRAEASGIERGSVRAVAAPTGDGLGIEIAGRERSFGHFMSLSGGKRPAKEVALRGIPVPGGLGAHKWADRSLLDEAQAGLPDDALSLIVAEDGAALEASRANLFAVRDDALFTPPLDGRILPGITRMRVLEIAGDLDLEAKETTLSRSDLFAADEVFLTGSLRGIEPAASLDGTALAGGGPIAAALTAELRRAWLGAPVA
jgi:para-aminobenzoate synthetase / 4-amino-4-deoxychorismate lyase